MRLIIKQERQRVEQESQRAEQAEARLQQDQVKRQKLVDRLKELGIDPDLNED
jgi:hypothetical protein